MPDGGNRIIVIQINTTSNPLCLVNVYMPSSSDMSEYRDTLGQLQEILDKYSMSHSVIIAGDMNAMPKRKQSPRDSAFEEFN
ncbi:hypothetical protein KP79_PYT25907 [Mizuhopecten yessoensis]|uniref:Endonuclease/exonuclease/phosphatase domain-containing protein n=1 Tax=Mizuhopecten yessoensis TaxID=6573 RepID=A0A210PKH4_MIZYE|nr:hypothetical protein KP79_PYT25907 [Mizuhopecten yessoensis]